MQNTTSKPLPAKKRLDPSTDRATGPLTTPMRFLCARCRGTFPGDGSGPGVVALYLPGGPCCGVSCVDCLTEAEWDLARRGEDVVVSLFGDTTTT